MKTAAIALVGTTAATLVPNNVPVQSTMPGWHLGTKGADLEVRLFYDVFCPDSRDSHYVWKELLEEDSPVAGKKYKEIIDMQITTFVLPYHLHSF